jgi:hypothetical protein
MTTSTSLPSNIVTQALANVEVTAQTVAAVGGLPPQVAAVQTRALGIAQQIVPTVQTLRQQTQQFVAVASPLVAQALAALDGPNPGAAAAPVAAMQASAVTLSTHTMAASQQLGAARDQCDANVAAMSGVISVLDAQIAAANAQCVSDQQQVDSLNQNKLYWLALGPLGLIGLAVAIGEIATANNQVAAIEAQISALGQQSAQAAKMKIDVQQLSANVSALAGRLQDLQNAVDFVRRDVEEVMKDLGDSKTSGLAKAFLLTTQGELAVLGAETA